MFPRRFIEVGVTSGGRCRSKVTAHDYPWKGDEARSVREKHCYDHEELAKPRSFFLHDLDYLPEGFRAYPACSSERMIKNIDQK